MAIFLLRKQDNRYRVNSQDVNNQGGMMHENAAVIARYFKALQSLDAQTMGECYHSEATFQDAVFGPLNVEETRAMWRMLCHKAQNFSLVVQEMGADQERGSCHFVASYIFSKTGRNVVNAITSHFEFKEGRIFRQRDVFSLWKWARQAFGWVGLLFGWLPFFQEKIRREARKRLDEFIAKK